MTELDPLLHSQLRLAIMSVLMNLEEADFMYLKQKTEATSGNLSIQLNKLTEAGYISVTRSIVGKKTRTTCRVTDTGRKAFDLYVTALRGYLGI